MAVERVEEEGIGVLVEDVGGGYGAHFHGTGGMGGAGGVGGEA